DHRIWVASADWLLRLSTNGRVVSRAIPPENVGAMAAGPRGRMWMLLASGLIADVTRRGHVRIHSPGAAAAGLFTQFSSGGLAVAGSGHLWVVDTAASLVFRVTTGATCAVGDLVGRLAAHGIATLRANGCRARVAGHRGPPPVGARIAAQ